MSEEQRSLYKELEYFLTSMNWKAADQKTNSLVYSFLKSVAGTEENYYHSQFIREIPFIHLEEIDRLWKECSNGNFGFSVQKEIWLENGNRPNIKIKDWTEEDRKNYLRFAHSVGWLKSKKEDIEFNHAEFIKDYDELIEHLKDKQIEGSLPTNEFLKERRFYKDCHWHRTTVFFSRFTT